MPKPDKGIYCKFQDEHLMDAIRHGNSEAFNELYFRYNQRLMYYFFRMLGNSKEKACDFLQEIFVKIIERPELFNTSKKFSTWIFSVAHNMCKNEYRRISVRGNAVYEEDKYGYLPDDAGMFENEKQITAGQIYEEIEQLDEASKTAFILYYREDFSLKDISGILDLPEGTIKSKLFYTRQKLMRRLQIYDKD